MQHQPTFSPAQQDAMIDAGILGLLLGHQAQRPCSVDEIERETGDPAATTDSLRRLHAAGLIHRLDRFVWATRAAVIGEEIRV
jgi:hypothetical protein